MTRRLQVGRRNRRARWLPAASALLLAAATALAQYADDGRADWREGDVPPPPAYTTDASKLIGIDMPAASSIKLGIDPASITLDHATGIARYVVIARGPAAVNASYEGIRCATAEYRIYARQTEGNPWTTVSESRWKPMRGHSGVLVAHPLQLAQGGLCLGTTLRRSVAEAVQELRSGNKSMYN